MFPESGSMPEVIIMSAGILIVELGFVKPMVPIEYRKATEDSLY